MKRILLLTVIMVAFICSGDAFAQSYRPKKKGKKILPTATFGVKAGLNVEQMRGDRAIDTNFKLGGVGGIFLSVSKKHMGGRVEALVKTVRYSTKNSSYVHIRTTSLDIPFLYEYTFFDRLKVMAGPQLTAIISAKRANGMDVKNNFKNCDFSAVLGADVDLPLRLTVGVRIIQGFVNINNTLPSSRWRNSSAQLTVGFRLVKM